MIQEKKLVDMIDISEDVKEWNKKEAGTRIKALYKAFDTVEVEFFPHDMAQATVRDVLHLMPHDTLIFALKGMKWDYIIYKGINEGYQDKLVVFRVHCHNDIMLSIDN